ncbi:uncharacterized protein G2W53_038823 [Senna tora]|uniref:Uncharacterized protein n=1 Tax=Senna tora TaxID=362788 RepID=A0A834W2A5_9FABA|nr:uncharacterized protein G2W53_038823 [Senna tora]
MGYKQYIRRTEKHWGRLDHEYASTLTRFLMRSFHFCYPIGSKFQHSTCTPIGS